MGSSLSRLEHVVGVAVLVLIALSSKIGGAQPTSSSPPPANASPRAAAKKLVQDGNAAYAAKDYGRAIALYMRAFSLEPHPGLLFNVAQALRLAGCLERAVSFYERYLTLDPQGEESAAARERLSELKGARSGKAPANLAPANQSSCGVADDLIEKQPAAPEPKGRLKLSSTPEGVIVMLDGEKIGATPIERELIVGTHHVTLLSGGRLVGERKVEISADAAAEVSIPVELPRDDVERRPGPSRLAPVLLWVGGSLALAGSGVAFYLGQQGGPDHPEDVYVYPGANATGFVLAGAGAASIGVGAWLWMRGSRESAPVATIGPGGGYLGWQGRF
jgi:hypothetical protein